MMGDAGTGGRTVRGAVLALAGVVLLVGCTGERNYGIGPASNAEPVPLKRSLGGRGTADAPPVGGGGGAGASDATGSGGGITGSGAGSL